jgi:hypothetical protein
MAKNTSLLTKNTPFKYKFHFDTTKWQKQQNGSQFTITFSNYLDLKENY